MSRRTKSKARPVTGDIPDFSAELTRLVSRYVKAGCCHGCLAGVLVSAAVRMVATADGVCWSASYPEEVKLIGELTRLIVGRSVDAPEGATLQ